MTRVTGEGYVDILRGINFSRQTGVPAAFISAESTASRKYMVQSHLIGLS
jgi:hypothetical protein